MPKLNAKGYVIVQDGCILVETVSNTKRAAKVNWLMTKGHTMVFNHDSDNDIESMFKFRTTGQSIHVVECSVEANLTV